jgi:hypothetical protein
MPAASFAALGPWIASRACSTACRASIPASRSRMSATFRLRQRANVWVERSLVVVALNASVRMFPVARSSPRTACLRTLPQKILQAPGGDLCANPSASARASPGSGSMAYRKGSTRMTSVPGGPLREALFFATPSLGSSPIDYKYMIINVLAFIECR